jgi:AraC-like DNA-binding protein
MKAVSLTSLNLMDVFRKINIMEKKSNKMYIHVCLPTVARSVFNARELINADVSNHIRIKELAHHSGTNECTLKRGFKNIFKITVYQYLLKKRMRHAKHLLRSTELKEREIAVLCGYETLAGFVTTFRRYFGCRPHQLRI